MLGGGVKAGAWKDEEGLSAALSFVGMWRWRGGATAAAPSDGGVCLQLVE